MGSPATAFACTTLLKRDLFGRVERGHWQGCEAVRRCWRQAPLAARPLAGWLAAREARALRRLPADPAWPRLLHRSRRQGLVRSWLAGAPLHEARPADPAFYSAARRLLVRLHRAGVAHNDTAKEPNWLVRPDGSPGLIDFQLASCSRRRGRCFRMLAREDLRHLLKHKRAYCPAHLTPRERALLADPSGPARWLRRWAKPLYTLVTRRWLGWRDDEGRGRPRP